MALCNSIKETTEQRIKCLTTLIEAGANPNASNKQRYLQHIYFNILIILITIK